MKTIRKDEDLYMYNLSINNVNTATHLVEEDSNGVNLIIRLSLAKFVRFC